RPSAPGTLRAPGGAPRPRHGGRQPGRTRTGHGPARGAPRRPAGPGATLRLRPRRDAAGGGASGGSPRPGRRGEPRPVAGLRGRRAAGRRTPAEVPVRLHRGAGVRRGDRGLAGAPMNLAVEVAGLRFKNPLIAASGTFGYGVEYEGLLDLSRLGGLVSKGLYLEPRDGCPTPRIVETPSGLLNAIGLQGVGVRAFVRDVLPRLARHDTGVLVNVCGDTVEEHAAVARILDGAPGVHGLEINISCPNVKKG